MAMTGELRLQGLETHIPLQFRDLSALDKSNRILIPIRWVRIKKGSSDHLYRRLETDDTAKEFAIEKNKITIAISHLTSVLLQAEVVITDVATNEAIYSKIENFGRDLLVASDWY